MNHSRIVLALGASRLVARRGNRRWSRQLSTERVDETWWGELREAFTEMREQLGPGTARVTIRLMPPLVSVRTVGFPRLRPAELERVAVRDAHRYFPGMREPQVVGLEPVVGRDRHRMTTVLAVVSEELINRVKAIASEQDLRIESFEPAHAAWARLIRRDEPQWIAIVGSSSAECICGARGRIIEVRRTLPTAARLQSVVGAGPTLVFADPASLPVVEAIAGTWSGPVENAFDHAISARGCTGLELVPPTEAVQRKGRVKRTVIWLWTLAAAGLLLAFGLHHAVLQRELAALSHTRRQHQSAVQAAMRVRAQVAEVEAMLLTLESAQANSVRWTTVLEQVSQHLPRHAFLTGFHAIADSIRLEGLAGRAAEVFEGLGRAEGLTAIQPAGPIRQELRDSAAPVERFLLVGRVRPLRPGSGP